MESFLATVDNVYPTNTDFLKKEPNETDNISIYSSAPKFSDKDARMYGAITYLAETSVETDYAFPFDKNNFTFPIKGETVVIFKIGNQTFWMPYTNTPYSNYRRDYITYKATIPEDVTQVGVNTSAKDLTATANAGGQTKPNPKPNSDNNKYKKNEKIKFLKPKDGDTILSGRVGNTIRLSEFFLSSDGKSHPGIFIRNKQNPENDNKKIGEMVDEDINKDGTSVYIVSGKTKVPFKETIKQGKTAFGGYPSDFSGDQLFLNSDRVVLSAKAKEFIIFGKGSTGIITDGTFSVDAAKPIHLHSSGNVTIESAGGNQIFLNSNSGKVFLGKNSGAGAAGAPVQQMVLGGELIEILTELISAILNQTYWTPSGPTDYGMPPGPINNSEFAAVQSKLSKLLSSTNFLSK
jgi:hypothetical protein